MESMIACVDDGTKKVVDALKRQQMWENTFMLWSSDNGGKTSEGANNWPLRGNKARPHHRLHYSLGSLHESLRHV